MVGLLVGGVHVCTGVTRADSADLLAGWGRQVLIPTAVPFGALHMTGCGSVVVDAVLICSRVQVVGTAAHLDITVLLGLFGRVREGIRVNGVEDLRVVPRIGLPLAWMDARRGLGLPGQLAGVPDGEPVPAALVHLSTFGADGGAAGMEFLGALGGAFVKPSGGLGLVDSGHDGDSVPSGVAWQDVRKRPTRRLVLPS